MLHADIGLNCVYFAPRMMDSLTTCWAVVVHLRPSLVNAIHYFVDFKGLARRVNAKLLMASTSEVYGGNCFSLKEVGVGYNCCCVVACTSTVV